MGKHICLDVTSDGNKYSSPMPIIGLYIAASTLVCLIFMICDLFHGLRHKKPWIPCRFFSLNSLTLTLLAISSKLPVDLTTPMPSAQDQLSKLSGSALISISMSFFSISLATQSDSERLSNMISLTIFVVTVVVNICIQMITGVIFSFILEHVIIISCMLLMLTVMWYTIEICIPWYTCPYLAIGELKNINPLNYERKCMLQRLKLVYVSSYKNNPELEFLDTPFCFNMFTLSILCALVLLQAALRSLILKDVDVKFRCGVSDYKWSMLTVVVTQILTVLVGGIATIYRWLFSFKMFFNEFSNEITKETKVYFFSPSSILSSALSKLQIMSFFIISRKGFMSIFQTTRRSVIMVSTIVIAFISVLAFFLYSIFYILITCFGELRNVKDTNHIEREEWIQINCEENIKKWMEKDKRDSLMHLIQLLSKTPPSQEPLTNKIPITSNEKVSCLLVVVFVRVAIIALPNICSATLIHTLDEVFQIIYFIDKKMNANKRRYAVAKELWMNRENNSHWFHRRFIKPSICEFQKTMDEGFLSQQQLDLRYALGIIEGFKKIKDRIMGSYIFEENALADNAIDTVHELIIGKESRQDYSSIDELNTHIEQLFVDMLHFFLSQFPLAIFKHLVESPIQQYEERTRCVVKLLCKLEELEGKVHWVFPDGTGITTLTTPQLPPMDTQHFESVESNVDANVLREVTEDNEIQELAVLNNMEYDAEV